MTPAELQFALAAHRQQIAGQRAEIEHLRAERDLANRWASYCHSCALCGERPHDREQFESMPTNRKLAAEAAGGNEQ